MEFTIELGQTVEDKITGFKGVVNGLVNYISGCNQALIVPRVNKEGKYQDGIWLDIQRLAPVKGAKKIVLNNDAASGFDQAPPIR